MAVVALMRVVAGALGVLAVVRVFGMSGVRIAQVSCVVVLGHVGEEVRRFFVGRLMGQGRSAVVTYLCGVLLTLQAVAAFPVIGRVAVIVVPLVARV
ncbi:MAG TPA: hypothetical protein VLH10_23675 [Yinghuangia sp.]|nr:hypothetical protein [Yinghuangia sp.]